MKTEFTRTSGRTQAVESVLDKIAELNRSSPEDDDKNRSRVVWREVADGRVGFPAGLSMLPSEMPCQTFDTTRSSCTRTLNARPPASCGYVDKTLSDVESILSKWAYYAKKAQSTSSTPPAS